MSDLAYRRVAGGLDPVRDVLLWQGDGPALVWRSRGATVGRFAPGEASAARLRAAVAALGATALPDGSSALPEGPSAPPEGQSSLPADRLVEHLALDGASLVVPAGTEVAAPWGELLGACRAAVDDPGEPVAAITLVAQPPAQVRLEHRGREQLELGFGALVTAIRWTVDGAESGYAGARLREGVVIAGPGWSRVIELDPRVAMPVGAEPVGAEPVGVEPIGEPVATASFSIRDEGVWIPVSLEVARAGT